MNTSAVTTSIPAGIRIGARAGGAGFNPQALRKATPDQQRKAVAGEFEAIFVRQMLGKTMESMFDAEGGTAGSVYGGMLADTMAEQLTAGPGLGLGRFLEHQLRPPGPVAQPPATHPTA